VVDALTGAQAREDGGFFLEPVGRDEDGDRFADHLVGQVAEDARRTLVPRDDDAFEVLADDGVIRGRYDGRQTAAEFVGVPLRPVCADHC